MTIRHLALSAVSLAAAIFGLVGVVGAFAVEGTPVLHATTAVVGGLLLIAGAWLMYRRRVTGVALVWASALVYALVQLVPAISRHGLGAFSVLMGTFYVSVAIRVAFALAGHVLLRARHV
jgi:hypothetical protein